MELFSNSEARLQLAVTIEGMKVNHSDLSLSSGWWMDDIATEVISV